MTASVLLVDDHHLLRHALALAIADSGFRVVGEAGDGESGVRMAERLRPDLALFDLTMPVLDGIAATSLLRRRCPSTKVVILTMHNEAELVRQALDAGAVAFLGKDSSMAEVEAALRKALGEPEGSRKAPDNDQTLSPREIEVIQLVAHGNSYPEVARRLDISAKTVKNHLHSIFRKLDVVDRTQAVLSAAR
ncbi:MAG: response regulator transcription factor, partial [Acidimicrobiia bacterium]